MSSDEATLSTSLIVAAAIRASNDSGIPAYLVRRGDADRGTILLKLNRLDAGCEVWTQTRDSYGRLAWLLGSTLPEADASDYVRRAIQCDPDLWVVEVEDRTGINPFA